MPAKAQLSGERVFRAPGPPTQAVQIISDLLDLIAAKTGNQTLTRRFCIKCERRWSHSEIPRMCDCACHRATDYLDALSGHAG